MSLSSDQEKLLVALIDRIIPSDDFPSASEAGVLNYIQRQLTGDVSSFLPALKEGLASLDRSARASHQKSFVDIPSDLQDALLRQIENTPFFQKMIGLTSEGYYADPGNGGNLNAVSWAMVGYPGEPK